MVTAAEVMNRKRESVGYTDPFVDSGYTDRYVEADLMDSARYHELPAGKGFANQNDQQFLFDLLDDMVGYDIVTDVDRDDETDVTVSEIGGTPVTLNVDGRFSRDRSIRKARTIIENVAAKRKAEEICAFGWSDAWAARGPKFWRGRIESGPLLTMSGETWNVCVAKSVGPVEMQRVKANKITDPADARFTYTVFVRRHVGTENVMRRGRRTAVWTWSYDKYQSFTSAVEALSFMDTLVNAMRNEIQLNDQWNSFVFTPGEATPYDPFVLTQAIENQEEAAAAADLYGNWDRDDWTVINLDTDEVTVIDTSDAA